MKKICQLLYSSELNVRKIHQFFSGICRVAKPQKPPRGFLHFAPGVCTLKIFRFFAHSIRLSIIGLSLILLDGCGAGRSSSLAVIPKKEIKIKSIARTSRENPSTIPLKLAYRRLSLGEISEHLDMNEGAARTHMKFGNIHGYFSLIASNYPVGVEFTLYHISNGGDVVHSKNYVVNSNGRLVSPLDDTTVDLSNNLLFFSKYLPGEPADFVLISRDEKYYAATRIIPNPIEKLDSTGKRRLSVEIASPNKQYYKLIGTGFKPYVEYLLITRFEYEKLVYNLEADSEGVLGEVIGPQSPLITGGDASVELKGGDLERPILIDFQWTIL